MPNPPLMLSARAADLNGDGALDLIVTYDDSPVTSHYLQILINDGSGNFTDESVSRAPDSTRGLNATVSKFGLNLEENFSSDFYLTDFNGDGHIDIILKNGMQLMPVLLNDGTGHFIHLPPSFVDDDASEAIIQ